jgi:hypothetical protein
MSSRPAKRQAEACTLNSFCPIGPGNGTVWWDTLLLCALYLTSTVPLSHDIWKMVLFVPSVSVFVPCPTVPGKNSSAILA